MDNTKSGKKQKKPVLILKDTYGGISEKLKHMTREQGKTMKILMSSIKDGYKTVPEIARETGLPSNVVLWHLMAKKKYGEVIEGEERDGYYEYKARKKEK